MQKPTITLFMTISSSLDHFEHFTIFTRRRLRYASVVKDERLVEVSRDTVLAHETVFGFYREHVTYALSRTSFRE